jgi:hypothetical protein
VNDVVPKTRRQSFLHLAPNEAKPAHAVVVVDDDNVTLFGGSLGLKSPGHRGEVALL